MLTSNQNGIRTPEKNALSFVYDRRWQSLSDNANIAEAKLEKALLSEARDSLPPLYRDLTPAQLEKEYHPLYKAANAEDLYQWRMLERNSNVPRGKRLIFASPMASFNYPLNGQAKWNKENVFVTLFGVPEYATRIMDNLKPSVRDLTSLALTCHHMAVAVSGNMVSEPVCPGSRSAF